MISAKRTGIENGYDLVHFTDVRVVRGRWRCVTCGAEQGEYALDSADATVTCHPCANCGEAGEAFEILELVGVTSSGEVVDLKPAYDRHVLLRSEGTS